MIEKGRIDFWADFKFLYRTLFPSIYHAQVKTVETQSVSLQNIHDYDHTDLANL